MQGVWVQALVRELRSHMTYGMAKRKRNFCLDFEVFFLTVFFNMLTSLSSLQDFLMNRYGYFVISILFIAEV